MLFNFNLCDQNELGVSFVGNLVYWVQDLHSFDSDLEKVVSDLNVFLLTLPWSSAVTSLNNFIIICLHLGLGFRSYA